MVDNVGSVGRAGEVMPKPKTRVYRIDDTPAQVDVTEFSSDVMRLKGVEGVRMDKVMEFRKKIAAGNYPGPEKLSRALDFAIEDALKT